AFGECLELDPAPLVETVGGVDQAEDTVLNEISYVDRVGHRGGHPTGKRLNERDPGNHATVLAGCRLRAHPISSARTFRVVLTVATAIPTVRRCATGRPRTLRRRRQTVVLQRFVRCCPVRRSPDGGLGRSVQTVKPLTIA